MERFRGRFAARTDRVTLKTSDWHEPLQEGVEDTQLLLKDNEYYNGDSEPLMCGQKEGVDYKEKS